MSVPTPRSPLSSAALRNAPAPTPIPCPRCTRTCTVIRLTGQEGVPLTLHSCHFCEHRWWTRGDAETTQTETSVYADETTAAELIGLPEVLAATRVEKVARRTLAEPA